MRAVRWAVAVVLWAAGAYAAVLGARLPMEAGGLLLGPVLIVTGAAAVLVGAGLVVPRVRRRREPRPLDSPALLALAAFCATGLALRALGVI